MNISALLPKNFLQDSYGIWRALAETQVSFPADGHARNAEVEDRSFWFNCRNKVITSMIQKVMGRPRSFVDVGGGTGTVANAIAKMGVPVALIEPIQSGCFHAASKGTLTVVNSTLSECAFPAEAFEAAGLFDVLEHLEQESTVLAEVKRVIAHNGYLVITVPAYQSLWSSADVAARHYRRYSLTQATGLLRANGFEPIYATYFFMPLVLPIVLFRSLKTRFGLGSKAEHSQELVASPFMSFVMRLFTEVELFCMKMKFPIPFGSSVLVVARSRHQ